MLTFKQRNTLIEIKSTTQAGTPATLKSNKSFVSGRVFSSKSVYPLRFLPKAMHVPESADNLQNHQEAACTSHFEGLPNIKPLWATELPFSPPY